MGDYWRFQFSFLDISVFKLFSTLYDFLQAKHLIFYEEES